MFRLYHKQWWYKVNGVTGFIGKGLTRQLNRLWNYGCKGLLGTLALALVFPAVCLSVSLLSVLITVTAFIW